MITLNAFKVEYQSSKKIFIWNHDNLIKNSKKNYELHFSINPILNKIEIKKRIKKIKISKTKKKNITCMMGKPTKPVN